MEMKGKVSLSKKEESSSSKKRTMSRTTSSEESRTFHQNGHQTVSYTHKDGTSETSLKKSSYTKSRRSYEVKTQSITIDSEEVEKKCHKERDKDSSSSKHTLESSYKPSCSSVDQDLEFYPIDDYNTSPSTFTAWDAFMSGNQAFFREPCVPDYTCSTDFSYMDVIPEEDTSVMESDTDDTGSSVSTVIDKFSRTSTANSSFSERIKTKEDTPLVTFDLEQVLSPFEQLEKELDEGGSDLMSHTTNGEHDFKENHYDEIQTDDTDICSLKSSQFQEYIEDSESHIQEYCLNGGVNLDIQSKSISPMNNGEIHKHPHDKLHESVTPLVPLRSKYQNNCKENATDRSRLSKDKKEEKLPLATPPPIIPRKRESYPTPTVPPRMSKHSPARRTRSDPGSSDNQTPSRIPRPTFVTRSSTFTDKTVNSSGSVQRLGSIPKINKSQSPKMSIPKKLRFQSHGKANEEGCDKNEGLQKNSRAGHSSAATGDIESNSSIGDRQSDGDGQEKKTGHNTSPLAENLGESSSTTLHGENGPNLGTSEVMEITPDNSERMPNSSSTLQQERISGAGSSDLNPLERCSARNNLSVDARLDSLSRKEGLTSNFSDSIDHQPMDLARKTAIQPHLGSLPKIEIVKEATPSSESEEMARSATHSKDMSSFTLDEETIERERKAEEALNSDEVHQRPIEDILQALDNLCSAPCPRDVEIGVEWNPMEPSLINIAERILAPGLTSPEGSVQKDADESFMASSSPKEYFRHGEPEDCLMSEEETRTSVLLVQEKKPQQTTPEVPSSLTASDWEKSESKALGPGTPAVSLVGPNALLQQVLQAPEGSHALPIKGHCHQDSALPDTNPEIPEMDMLNKLEKSALPLEERIVDSYGRQPPDGHEYPRNCQDPFQPITSHFESEDTSTTRHSFGCDDSGVFLEDLPYTPEPGVNPNPFEPNHQATASPPTILNRTFKVDSSLGHTTSNEMRQYSIETHNGQDSDAEKSDDMGLASSSVDSADDLDIDSIPAMLQMPTAEALVYTKQKPPPVPVRKSLLNGKVSRTVEFEPFQNHSSEINREVESSKNVLNKSYDDVCGINQGQNFQSFKWKSEECLKSDVGSRWSLSGRKNEKAISVKDRIAMFSELESGSNAVKKESPLQRFASEICVKHAHSVEDIDKNGSANAANDLRSKLSNSSSLNRDNKWFSMQSISSPSSSPMTSAEPSKPATEKVSENGKSPFGVAPQINSPSYPSNNVSSMNSLKIETDSYKCLEKPIISSYPQTQLTNNKRYNYGLYSLKPLKSPEELAKKSGSLLSIIDSKKQLPKLKGLVIPETPPQTSNSKALPTILSHDSVVLPMRNEAHFESISDKDSWKKSVLSTMSLPRNRTNVKTKLESCSERDVSGSKLIDPPWKMSNANNTLPKYSPAFKRRTLELPHALGSSLSPTPPSSITSPLSPPPSSPSSVCSSNASSSSIATKQQNIFQFSLSHSKPVTPVLPEKPIMSPPSLPSDVEYEGDNSEDSSTSASPMLSSQDKGRESLDRPLYSSSVTFYSEASRYPKPSSTEESSNAQLPCYTNNSFSVTPQVPKREVSSMVVKSEFALQNNLPPSNYVELGTVEEIPHRKFSLPVGGEAMKKEDDHLLTKTSSEFIVSEISKNGMPNGNNFSNGVVSHPNPANIYHVSQEEADDSSGNRNGFMEAKQEVLIGKFRAQPLKFNEVTAVQKSGDLRPVPSTNYKFQSELGSRYQEAQHPYPASTLDLQNGDSFYCDPKSDSSTLPRVGNGFASEKHCWSQSDLIPFMKRASAESEDDDNQSSLSQRTEDSRHTTDEYLSDTTVDSVDKSVDPDLKPRRLSQQKTVLRAAVDGTDSVQKFRALAEKWEQRAEPSLDAKSPTPPVVQTTHPAPRRESRSSQLLNNSPPVISNSILNNSSLKLPPSLLPRYPPTSEFSLEKKTCPVSMSQRTSREGRPSLLRSTSLTEDVSDLGWKENPRPHPRQNSVNTQDEVFNPVWSDSSHAAGKTAALSEEKNGKNDPLYNYHKNAIKEECGESSTKTHTLPSYTKRLSNGDDIWKGRSPTINGNNRANDLEDFNGSWSRAAKTGSIRDSADYKKGVVGDGANGFASTRSLSRSQVLHSSVTNGIKLGTSSFFPGNKSKSISVSDIRKAFESQAQNQSFDLAPKPAPRRIASEDDVLSPNGGPKRRPQPSSDHQRISSFDSTSSEPDILSSNAAADGRYGSAGSLPSITRDPYGSVTSLSSTTSLISSQELQQLIEEANQSLEEAGTLFHEILVVVLHREIPGGSIGITLAGGADYEVKEITVHKVISGSLADRDGRIRKGDRVISINGRNLKGISHRDALEILKAPRPEVVLVISRERSEGGGQVRGVSLQVQQQNSREGRKKIVTTRKTPEDAVCCQTSFETEGPNSHVVEVGLVKDGTGLGFSIEGGKDSPLGDRPLIIKRVFKGGIADKEGHLEVGDEIISVSGQAVTNMTRTEAWNFLKKLPDGPIVLKARKSLFPAPS